MITFLILLVIGFVIYERFFSKHILVSNFPLIAWGRYFFERVGKPFRQYWFLNDREEKPFSRIERSYVYQAAKGAERNKGFGSDADWESINHFNILQSNFPKPKSLLPKDFVPCYKIIGPQREKPFFLESVINVSAISYGSQGSRATKIMNMGCALSGAYHNTGEGGFTAYHKTGADVVWQIGTGYFGARHVDGSFNLERLVQTTKDNPEIKAIEIKISQGAKPGKGGILPAIKVTEEIAEFRGVPMGQDCVSPSNHTAFSNNRELIELIEEIAKSTGIPVGIKAAVGQMDEWKELFSLMKDTNQGPDFIQIDGAEGGTGSAPPHYADHMARVPNWIEKYRTSAQDNPSHAALLAVHPVCSMTCFQASANTLLRR